MIELRNVSVEYFRKGESIKALKSVSLTVQAGSTMGLVGESGCGKSSLALSILRLIGRHEGRISGDALMFNGQNLLESSDEEMRRIRGKDISMVFQDPFSAFNPVLRIGDQIGESLRAHDPKLSKGAEQSRVRELLSAVRLPEPDRIARAYPHQISGGQRQRAMIGMAIANRPKLLIADEPTTALDATVQREILDLLESLKKDLNMTILLVTHHFGIIARYADHLAVLYAGEIVEQGKTSDVIKKPQHPYTRALLQALPGAHPSSSRAQNRSGRLPAIPGAPPDPAHGLEGCAFHPRCQAAQDRCKTEAPVLKPLVGLDRKASCHFAPFD